MATGVGGWSWQNPLPQGNGYAGGYFLDADHGWLISRGTIFHTANGGVTLTVQARHDVRFSAITFVGAKHGWAVGPPTSGGADVLYRTTNGGRTWTRIPLQWSGGINGISFATTEVGWATLVHSILRTTDGGLHWTRYAFGKSDKTTGVQALSTRRAWVADGDTLLRTTDGGATWKHIPAGTATNLNVVCFTSAQSGWAGAGSYRSAGQIVHTTDGGLHWNVQLAGQGVTALSFADSSNGWATAGGAVYGTTDGGADWAPQDSAPYATWVLALTPLGAVIGNAGTSVGLSHTSDGGATWQSGTRAAGDYSGKLNDLQFVNTHDGWAVGSGGGILATTDGGATWGAEDSTVTADLNRVHFIDAMNGWAVGDQGTIVNTTDGGAHWAAQTSGTDYDLTGVTFTDAQDGWATGQTFDEDDYSSGVILHTTDGGQDWTTQLASLFDPSKQNPGVAFGGVAFADARHGWAVGETQGSDSTLNLSVIMHTTDGGTT
jgi:photosystem II stability/assembly factor-like uncharacterized protein